MRTVYDILNDVHMDTNVYDAINMSDFEKKSMQKRCFENIRQNKSRHRKVVASVASVMIIVLALGGTIYAYNKGLLEGIFKGQTDDYYENEHYNKALMESKYEGDIVVETNAKDELVEFQVLFAARGTYSVECAVLVTYNKDLSEGDFAVNIGLAYFDELYGKVSSGGGWSYSGWVENDVEVANNQEIFYLVLEPREYEDISNVDSITLEFLQRGEGAYIYNENEKFPVSSDGERRCWYLTVPITEVYEDFYYDVEDVYIENGTRKIDKIFLQPSQLHISMIVDEKEQKNMELDDVELIFSNGDRAAINDFCVGSGCGKSEFSYYFKSLIKTEEVEAVEIEGQLIQLK